MARTRGLIDRLNKKKASSVESDSTDTGSVVEPVSTEPAEKDLSKEFQFKGDISLTERLSIRLPVTNRTVTCMLHYIDPRFASASPVNPRHQALISESDPDVQSLVRSLETEGQRDPALAQKRNDGTWEIIYGTRRRFAAEVLHRQKLEQGGFPLRVWVPAEPIPEQDKAALAIGENEDRVNLSVWEKAKLIESLDAQGHYTNKAIGQMVRLAEQKVSEYRALAAIPESIIQTLVSPAEFTRRGGVALIKLAGAETGGFKAIAERLGSATWRFESMDALLAAAKPTKEKAVKKAVASRGKTELKDASGKTRFAIGRARGKDDALKIDAFGFSEADQTALIDALKKLIK